MAPLAAPRTRARRPAGQNVGGRGARASEGNQGPERAPAKGSLDTLAQLDQKAGPSTATGAAAKLQKRARSKFFSVPLATSLAELRGPLEKSYRNTIYCAHRLVQEGDQLRADVAGGAGGYCGNRWCLVCSRVRIARAITRYAPAIEGWRGYMVTLTIPNVGAAELPGAIEGMHRAFTAAKRAIKRTDRITFRALRKLECTHNQVRGDFHPHFHVIVDGEAGARALVRRWLEAYPEAVAAAQDVRPCGAGSAKELFKYFTKLVTKVQTKGGAVISRVTPPEALDVIFRAMRGRRVGAPQTGMHAQPGAR